MINSWFALTLLVVYPIQHINSHYLLHISFLKSNNPNSCFNYPDTSAHLKESKSIHVSSLARPPPPRSNRPFTCQNLLLQNSPRLTHGVTYYSAITNFLIAPSFTSNLAPTDIFTRFKCSVGVPSFVVALFLLEFKLRSLSQVRSDTPDTEGKVSLGPPIQIIPP